MSETLFHGPAAIFSECERFRYTLTRRWSDGDGFVQFIGLNPSTATATQDDPTVRRCVNFAKAWGYDGMIMTNLFAFRATDPRQMKAHPVPVGPNNDMWLLRVARAVQQIVCCWGQHGTFLNRANDVETVLGGFRLSCLRASTGEPHHPLYLPKTLRPIDWARQL